MFKRFPAATQAEVNGRADLMHWIEPDPVPVAIPEGARKGKAWIPIAGFPVPPFTLSIVPDEMAATNRLHDAFYMTGGQMEDPDIVIDGLHRTQIETVATTVSHRNDCFY